MLKSLLIVSSITLGTSFIATDAGACGLFGHHRGNDCCQVQTSTTCCGTTGYSHHTASYQPASSGYAQPATADCGSCGTTATTTYSSGHSGVVGHHTSGYGQSGYYQSGHQSYRPAVSSGWRSSNRYRSGYRGYNSRYGRSGVSVGIGTGWGNRGFGYGGPGVSFGIGPRFGW